MGNKWIYVRKLNARIEPVGGSKGLEIPFRAETTNEIIPLVGLFPHQMKTPLTYRCHKLMLTLHGINELRTYLNR